MHQATTIDVAPGHVLDTVRVQLPVAAAAVQGIVVQAERAPPMAATVAAMNARNAPPLGESDVFRMLPLLPSVAQPNDLLGRFHLAGGASDEHGVYLDGHPLQAPFHANNLLGAFNVAALERADVLMHHVPISIDGHLSGAVQLESKQLEAGPHREAVVSILSASATVAVPSVVNGVGVLVSGRATYLDQILRRLARASGSDDLAIPQYRDVLLRASHRTAWGLTSEAITFATRDSWIDDAVEAGRRPLGWGETLLGIKLGVSRGALQGALRLSANEAAVEYGGPGGDGEGRPTRDFIRLGQTRLTAAGTIDYGARRWQSSGGLAIDRRSHRHAWDSPRVSRLFTGAMPLQYDHSDTQQVVRAFGDVHTRVGSQWQAGAGAHASLVGGRAYVSPRVILSGTVRRTARVIITAERRNQFDAILGEPVEGSVTQPQFLLDVPRTIDLAALSVELRPESRWRDWAWSPTVTTYSRQYRNRTIPLYAGGDGAPPTGSAEGLFSRVTARTMGAAARVLLTRSRGAVIDMTYTLQSAQETVAGRRQPTSWDAPHQFSGFVSLPAWRSWRFTAATQMRSGAAVTPVIARIFEPSSGGIAARLLYGDPNSARLAPYARIDLGTRRSWTTRSAEWTVTIQALNVLARHNVLEYDLKRYFACGGATVCGEEAALRRGIPLVPSIGMEVRW